MPAVEPVADRFGHRVGLVPHDRVPEDPPVVLERERDPPGQAEQVLRVHPGGSVGGDVGAEVGVHPGGAAAAGGVGVAEVEPARPVVGEHPPRLAEDVPHGVHVGGGAVLVAVLAGHAVVPLAPVGRAGHDAVRRLAGHRGEDRAGVADVERPRLAFRAWAPVLLVSVIGHHPFPLDWNHWRIPAMTIRICGAALVAASRKPSSAQTIACQTCNPWCRYAM